MIWVVSAMKKSSSIAALLAVSLRFVVAVLESDGEPNLNQKLGSALRLFFQQELTGPVTADLMRDDVWSFTRLSNLEWVASYNKYVCAAVSAAIECFVLYRSLFCSVQVDLTNDR